MPKLEVLNDIEIQSLTLQTLDKIIRLNASLSCYLSSAGVCVPKKKKIKMFLFISDIFIGYLLVFMAFWVKSSMLMNLHVVFSSRICENIVQVQKSPTWCHKVQNYVN